MKKLKQAAEQYVDPKLVVSAIVASIFIGLMVYGARAAGFSKAATIVKGG